MMKTPAHLWPGRSGRLTTLAALAGVLFFAMPAFAARDAAFLDPGNTGEAKVTEAIRVEPKNEVDIGETALG